MGLKSISTLEPVLVVQPVPLVHPEIGFIGLGAPDCYLMGHQLLWRRLVFCTGRWLVQNNAIFPGNSPQQKLLQHI